MYRDSLLGIFRHCGGLSCLIGCFAGLTLGMQNVTAGNGEGPLGLARVKLTEMLPEDGAASGVYTRAVESLSQSLARNNAAIIELNGEDAALVRCALESAKLYFRSRSQNAALWNSTNWLKLSGYLAAPSRDMYFYRAGR
jgi:hypothetical protein